MLEPILEDRNKEQRLKTDRKEVVGTMSLLTKKKQRDKNVANEVKATLQPITHTYNKSLTTNLKNDDAAMEELV